jgi:hypothetical protein
MSFSSMKKNAGRTDAIVAELQKIQTAEKTSYKDDRFWKPEMDKSDNGYAVIRFLPPVEGEDTPWVRIFNHGFKGKGGWFIENCPTTIGGKCPLCEANSELWNSGNESDKDIARSRKRRLQYISNIMVVEDPKNPANEGKVFLYKFGKKIFDKVMESLQPEFSDEEAVNPFDFWKGANFKLKIRKVAGFTNYDKSEFADPSALSDDDAQLEEIWGKQYKLQEFVGGDQFKSYGELKEKLDRVLTGGARGGDVAESAEDVNQMVRETKREQFGSPSAPVRPVKPVVEEKEVSSGDDEDDALSYFKKLADES